MAALNEMQPDCHLWFAFQPNTLKDFNSQLPKEWPKMVSDMRSRLEYHFYVPTLSNNLRNASEVFNMTEAVKSEGETSKHSTTVNRASSSCAVVKFKIAQENNGA